MGIAIRAYPWASLDALSVADVELVRALSRIAGALAADGRATATLGQLVGVPVTARLQRLEPVASAPDVDALAVALVVEGDEARGAIVCEVEPGLAIDLVARAVKRPPPILPGAGARDAAADAAAASALGALLVKALRRSSGSVILRAHAAGRASAVVSSTVTDACAAVLTVMVDADVYRARVLVSRQRAMRAPEPRPSRTELARLGDVSLTVPVIAATAWAPAREVSALRVGDVWMPGGLSPSCTAVVLAGAHLDRGIAATLDGDRGLVIGNAIEELGMTTDESDTILESALDAPVVVRVELGAVEMPAREWAALKSGDVVRFPKRVGAPVTLRAGSVALATGELVDVDGEIGVRVTALLGGGA